MRILILIAGLFVFELRAGGAIPIAQLAKAKGLQQVLKAERLVNDLYEYRQTCNWELSLQRIPAHCYFVEQKRGQIRHKRLRLSQSALNQLCFEAVKATSDLETLKRKIAARQVSVACKNAMRRQIEIIHYQQQPIPSFL